MEYKTARQIAKEEKERQLSKSERPEQVGGSAKKRQGRERTGRRHGIFSICMVIVVLVTSYALILPARTAGGTTFCGMQEHVHDDSCQSGEEACKQEEHVHSLACYSDPTADLETAADWEKTLPADTRDNAASKEEAIAADAVAAVAKSQVGYGESGKNYEVAEDGKTIFGYSRYGAWLDRPYGPWALSYLAFCLSYGGAGDAWVKEVLPADPTDESAWISALRQAGYEKEAGEKARVGDLVFLQEEEKEGRSVPHAGIVLESKSNIIEVAEGDRENQVRKSYYRKSSDEIIAVFSLCKNEDLDQADGLAADTGDAANEDGKEEGAAGLGLEEEQGREGISQTDQAEEEETRYTDKDSLQVVQQDKVSGENYEIAVTYGEDAGIPDGAELRVHELTESDEAYLQFKRDVSNLREGTENIPQHPTLLDISIWADGEEIEPAENGEVRVDIKLAKKAVEGLFTGDDAALLVNGTPITENKAEVKQSVQIFHQIEEGKVEIADTIDRISDEDVTVSFTTDSFSNYLVFLDQDVDTITVGPEDTITLRPYSQWVWDEQNRVDGQTVSWKMPDPKGHMIMENPPKTYTDNELKQTYTFYQLTATNNPGEFDIETTAGKKIHVVVTGKPVSEVPGTVEGLDEIKVNLFNYDLDHSLDVQGNVASYIDAQSGVYKKFEWDKDGQVTTREQGPYANDGINAGSALKFLGWGASNGGNWINNYKPTEPTTNIVQDKLTTGTDGKKYPILNGNGNTSLQYLFSEGNSDVQAYKNVGGLFRQENGYYYFNSNTNYAYYDNGSFTLYEHTYTQDTSGSGVNSKPIGFFPFHQYDSNNHLSPNHDANLDHHFGMSFEQAFSIPAGGKDINGNPIIFEFSGDDDMWVYIGDDLALDLGGIHQPITGKIDFSTIDSGYATVYVGGKDVKHVPMTAYKEYTLRAFYLERGGCDSNCSIKFNLPTYKTLKLSKRLNGLSEKEYEKYKDEWFDYQLVVNGSIYHSPAGAADNPDLRPILKDEQGRVLGSDYKPVTDANGNLLDPYQNKTEDEKEAILRWMVITEDKIQLKDGWTIEIPHLARTDTFYAAEEDNVNMDEFERPHAEREFHDTLNGEKHEEEVDLTDSQTVDNSHIHDWKTETYSLQETEKVTFTNTLKEKNIDVEKQWSDGAEAHTNDSITFRLVAKIPSGEGEGLYTSVHGGNIWGKVTGEVNNNAILGPHEEEVLLQKYTLSSKNNWKMSFEHLPAVTEHDEVITYSVEEVSTTQGYTTSDPTFVESYDVDVFKYFPDDSYPEETITFHLKRNGQYYKGNNDGKGNSDTNAWGSKADAKTFTLRKSSVQDDSYHCRFKDMPDGGYSIEQVDSTNPLTEGLAIYKRSLKMFTIRNEKMSGGKITVQKVWKDADGKDITSDSAQHQTTITYDIYRIKHVHEWDLEHPVTDQQPTDTATGRQHYVCKHNGCSETKDEITSSLGCIMGGWTVVQSATCEEEGKEQRVCENNSSHVEERPINALGHQWGEWVITKAASSAENGSKERTCARCNKKEIEVLPKLQNVFPNTDIVLVDFNDVWPTKPTSGEQVTIYKSGIFKHNNKYYVVYDNKTDNWNQFENNNIQSMINANVLCEVLQSPIYDPGSFSSGTGYNNNNKERSDLRKGILYKTSDGTWYVYKDNSSNGKSPEQDSNRWYRLPKTSITNVSKSSKQLAPRKATPLPAITTTGFAPLNELIAKIGYTDDKGDHLYYYAERYKKGETLGPNAWTAQYDVELQDADGNAWTYYFVETDPSSGWITTYDGQDNGLKNGGKTTITNQKVPEKGSLTITKAVRKNGSTDASATGTFYYAVYSEEYNPAANPAQTYVSAGSIDVTAGTGSVTVNNLPLGTYYIYELTGKDGTPIVSGANGTVKTVNSVVYTVTGSGTQVSVTVSGGAATLTNNHQETTVTLKKVAKDDVLKDDATLLNGATFTVTKYTDSKFNVKDTTSVLYEQTKADTKNGDEYTLNGTFEFTGLSIGFYRVSEDIMPAGYVKTGDDPVFEVRQKTDVPNELEVVLYQKGEDGTYEPVSGGSTAMVRITAENTLIIGNEPGVALPSAGGPGTRLFTILGGILICFASALVVRRRWRFI